MKVPAVQHPVNTYSPKPQVINHFPPPNQDRIPVSSVHIIQLMYVRCRLSRLQMSSSNNHSHCFTATRCSLKDGDSCLSQKRKYFKKTLYFSSITKCYESFNIATFQTLLTNKINWSANGVGRIVISVISDYHQRKTGRESVPSNSQFLCLSSSFFKTRFSW